MNSQQSMFDMPESSSQKGEEKNADPGEQYHWESPPREGYAEYPESPYMEGGMRSIGDGKIRPRQPQRTHRGRLIGLIVAIALLCFIALGSIRMTSGRINSYNGVEVHPFGGDNTYGERSEIFNVGAQPTLFISDDNMPVHIQAGDSGRVVITERGHDDDSRTLADGIQTSYNSQNNTLNINIHGNRYGPFHDDEAELDITVPTTGNIQMHTISGDLEVEGVNGQLTLGTDKGSIEANNVTGQLNARAAYGDIKVEDSALSGTSSLSTGYGNITYAGVLNPRGSYQFTANAGDVDISLPPDSSFHLNTSSSSTNISNDFGSNSVGGNPQAQISITANQGSISIENES